jgi:hypothetical protein
VGITKDDDPGRHLVTLGRSGRIMPP